MFRFHLKQISFQFLMKLSSRVVQSITHFYLLRLKTLSIRIGDTLKQKRFHSEAGFTLIEIMVVIAIIGILATMIVPKIMGRPDEARRTAAKHDVGTLVQSLKLYRLDIGRYPTAEQGLKALVEKPSSEPIPQNWKVGGYLDSLPKDPWGSAYQYINPGTHGEIDVYSFGADAKTGGVGADADIGNW
jgi:general secretion pathway protein G